MSYLPVSLRLGFLSPADDTGNKSDNSCQDDSANSSSDRIFCRKYEYSSGMITTKYYDCKDIPGLEEAMYINPYFR